MKIKVGDYVRTRAGHFYKITRIDENGLIYWNKIQCGWSMEQLKDIIVKHSKNIIDLIEKGDYVNGYKVEEVSIETNEVLLDHNGFGWITLKNGDKIVSHEQFANIEYKVEGNE